METVFDKHYDTLLLTLILHHNKVYCAEKVNVLITSKLCMLLQLENATTYLEKWFFILLPWYVLYPKCHKVSEYSFQVSNAYHSQANLINWPQNWLICMKCHSDCSGDTVPLSDLLLPFCEVTHWIPRLKSLLGPHNPATEMDMAKSAFDDLVKKCFSWICSTGRSHLIFYELLCLGWGVVHTDYMIQYLVSRLCLSFYANKTCQIIGGIKI